MLGGAAGFKRLDCSPPTMANKVQSPARPLSDFRMCESCRKMSLVSGFLHIFPIFPSISFRRCCILILIDSQDLATQISSLIHMSVQYRTMTCYKTRLAGGERTLCRHVLLVDAVTMVHVLSTLIHIHTAGGIGGVDAVSWSTHRVAEEATFHIAAALTNTAVVVSLLALIHICNQKRSLILNSLYCPADVSSPRFPRGTNFPAKMVLFRLSVTHHVPRPTGRDLRTVFDDYLTCQSAATEALMEQIPLQLVGAECVAMRWAVANQYEADSAAARRRRVRCNAVGGSQSGWSRFRCSLSAPSALQCGGR
ncbi:hypothetical protein PR048_014089 [Dryococelus australis]|uniref:Uncharacterized protein n=1 Tax=Dryococelus australis TaxID=614101 RepID=A0ABQ9HUW9_9NEOP|nr:hypothetical protein PR048_014089 [Dryococelus australis]